MNRQLTQLPAREDRHPEPALPGHLQRLERGLAHDLAALIRAGLIRPVGRIAGGCDATLRFGTSEIDDVTAAGVAMHALADEDLGSSGMEKER